MLDKFGMLKMDKSLYELYINDVFIIYTYMVYWWQTSYKNRVRLGYVDDTLIIKDY